MIFQGRLRRPFLYNSSRNLIEEKYIQGESCRNALVFFIAEHVVYCVLRNSKRMKISYDWRGLPVEILLVPTDKEQDKARAPVAY